MEVTGVVRMALAIFITHTAMALSRMADSAVQSVGSTVEADSMEEDLAEAAVNRVKSAHSLTLQAQKNQPQIT
jgi:hypothetical protein